MPGPRRQTTKNPRGRQCVKEYIDGLFNENLEIRVDTRIRTDTNIRANKPDIFVYDKIRKEIILIEVGITSQDNLQSVECEKLHKYDMLANELQQIHRAEVKIIPYVLTWDGIVTKYHDTYAKYLGVARNTRAYIQCVVMKRTLESLSIDFRRRKSLEEPARRTRVEEAISKLAEDLEAEGQGERGMDE